MIVVSDTSPLHYLVLIGHEDLLPQLYGRVITTPIVIEELSRPATPKIVTDWSLAPPDWLEIRTPIANLPQSRIDPGEQEAIALAAELAADLILMDDRDAVIFAREAGFTVTGTLGVLRRAHRENLVSLRASLNKLAQTNFRHTAKLFEELIRREEGGSL